MSRHQRMRSADLAEQDLREAWRVDMSAQLTPPFPAPLHPDGPGRPGVGLHYTGPLRGVDVYEPDVAFLRFGMSDENHLVLPTELAAVHVPRHPEWTPFDLANAAAACDGLFVVIYHGEPDATTDEYGIPETWAAQWLLAPWAAAAAGAFEFPMFIEFDG